MGRWTIFLAVGFLALSVGAVWVVLNVKNDTVQAVAAVADLMLLLGGGMIAFRSRLARRRRSPTPSQRDDAHRWLADEMRRRLHDEPQYRALNAPAAVPLRWRVRRPIVASRSEGKPADGGGGPEAFADWMSRAGVRRAALIGAAGAGKTTFVALVARAMLEPDGRDVDRPAPVIVSLADWDPRVDSLAAWIALRLAAEFPELDDDRDGYGRDISLALVQHREVWPILDGLDEVRDELVNSAVEQLRDLPASTPVLVTCRTDKFEELVGDGRLAPGMETVELEPLAGADVIPFLEAGVDDRPSAQRQPWARLTDRLRAEPDDPLTIALDTPLIAWLLWALYGRDGRDPSVLLDRHALPTATAIEDHLLRDLLPMALSGSSSKEVGRAERWLGFIARRSEKREVRGITWWATPLMVPRGLRRAVTAVVASVLMLPLATTDPAFVPFFGLMLALVPRLEPVSARFRAPFMVRSWVTTRDRLRRSLGIGCAIAVVVFTTFVGDPQEPAIGIVLAAIALGGFYAALSEAVQSGFAKARDKLHLPLRKIETADSPPPIIGLTWDWSRAAVVVAIALMFGALIALPEDDGLAGAGGGLALSLALSPFVWFGKSSLSAPFQRQREVFRANFRYSLCRGALFSLIVPAVMVGMYLADGDAAFESLESAEDRTSPLLGIVVLSGLLVPWFACASVLIAPCGQHMLATVLLALAGRLPWRPTSFFERMHKLGALRRSGMGYEFRHERFRNTLLGARETRTPNKVAETV